MKASKKPATLSQGIVQALGYLKGRPSLFQGIEPSAAVVGQKSVAFFPNEDESELDVVVVDDSTVGAWVRDRVL